MSDKDLGNKDSHKNVSVIKPTTEKNQTDVNRRDFVTKLGKFGLYTAPTMVALMVGAV